MDNSLFKVNGSLKKQDSFDFLRSTVELILRQAGFNGQNRVLPSGYSFSKEKGLVFYCHKPSSLKKGVEYVPFSLMPGQTEFHGLSIDDTTQAIRSWFKSPQVNEVNIKDDDWLCDFAHDGHNEPGFLIYVEDWGKVDGSDAALFGVKPCYLWHGK